MHELILGGQRSGKSRRAEQRAVDWLAAAPGREATLLATALGEDDEMRERISRHRADRAARVPALSSIEVPRHLGAALREHAAPQRLLVVDCLTLWLTQLLMPARGEPVSEGALQAEVEALLSALHASPGPVVLVSNEIGLGGVAMDAATRRFVDELGRLHQSLATACDRVTLMVAGLPMTVKNPTP